MAKTDLEMAVIDLQTRLSFQDSLLEELNQVIIGQQDQIAHLELAIETLKVQLHTMQMQTAPQQHEIPPHY